MSARVFSLAAAAAFALALAAIAVLLVLASDHEDNKAATIALAVTAGVSFIASGLVALWRRPENRTGYLLAAVGYLWFFGALTESNNDWVFTVGVGAQQPRLRRLHPPAARVPGRPADQAAAIAGWSSRRTCSCSPATWRRSCSTRFPTPRPARIAGARSRSEAATPRIRPRRDRDGARARDPGRPSSSSWSAGICASRGALRRALGPVLGAGALAMLVLALQVVIDAYSEGAGQPLEYVFLATFAMVPLAFLVGVLRSRLARVRRRRPPARARPGHADPRGARRRARRPDARDRVLAAGPGVLRLRRRKAAARRAGGAGGDARRARAAGRPPR